VGSACFFIGPFPGFVQIVGSDADAAIFFAGSVFFTFAAALALREGTWSAAVQFAGTLLFNVSTFSALQDSLSTHQENRLVWAHDVFGSACFLVSGALAYGVARGARPGREWKTAVVNLAGCVLFGVSALASYVVPSTGSMLDLAAANWSTALGALCFFIGALLMWPRGHAEAARSMTRSFVSKEV
jgi:hypothetical protein